MSSRYRVSSSTNNPPELATMRLHLFHKSKYRYMEFKYLYFQVQKLINKKVVLSLKYEQLKTPEIRISLIKPLVTKITQLSNLQTLHTLFTNHLPSGKQGQYDVYDTPQLTPFAYGSVPASELLAELISTNLVYVLLLLRYEFMIQSENHLVMYDLLTTKANICEMLAIRMLREYCSSDRINLLFVNPMNHHNEEYVLLKHTKHLDCFNTLELSILSKSKKFLSQPVIVQILERIYNGELILKDNQSALKSDWSNLISGSDTRPQSKGNPYGDYEAGLNNSSSSQDLPQGEKSVYNYKFNSITMRKVIARSHIVPKYQSLVINLKYGFLTALFLVLVLRHKQTRFSGLTTTANKVFAVLFWALALSFNFDNIVKLMHIEFKFLKKIIWTYVDLLIILLIDISFVLRILMGCDRIDSDIYYNFFSLISILLFPRMLSVFNNYEFFNMIVVSFKKMSANMIAMFCLFISLIFGFFLCFISLTIDLSTYEVAFSMLKLFFGFTPAVWDNWDRYNNLGRGIQLAYLFLIQFIVATILAIVLSNVFAKVSQTNKEEFEYLKTTNLIIYLKWGNLHLESKKTMKITRVFNWVVSIFKLPIIIIIYCYEILVKDNKKFLQKQQKDLKSFTFLNHEDDFYGDNDMIVAIQLHDEDLDVSTILMKSRRGSQQVHRTVSRAEANAAFVNEDESKKNTLIPQKSTNTLSGFRSGLVDSIFIDDYFGKRYGRRSGESRAKRSHKKVRSKSRPRNQDVMNKLAELEALVRLLAAPDAKSERSEFAVKDIYDVAEGSSTDSEFSEYSQEMY